MLQVDATEGALEEACTQERAMLRNGLLYRL